MTFKNNIIITAKCLFSFCSFFILFFSINTLESSEGDSVKSIEKKFVYYSPSKLHGKITSDSIGNITKMKIQRIHYFTMYEVLDSEENLYGNYTGAIGSFNSFQSFGSNNQDISILSNGRLLNSNINNNYNTEYFSPEYFESLEMLYGSESVLKSLKSTSSTVNIQEIIYDTKTPFTRLWYAQGALNYVSADGIFSHNILPNTNLNVGFKKYSETSAFDNQSVDSWNIRAILRYNFDSTSSITLSDNFTNHKSRFNGGNNPELSQSIYDPILSTPFFNLSDRVFRHDLNLSYSNVNEFISYSLKSYLTSSIHEQLIDVGLLGIDDEDFLPYSSENQIGLRGDLIFNINNVLSFESGAEVQNNSLEGNNYFSSFNSTNSMLYGKGILDLSENFQLNFGLKFNTFNNNNSLDFGTNLQYKSDSHYLTIDLSRFNSVLPFISKNMVVPENILGILSYKYSSKELHLSSSIFFRNVSNPLFFNLENTSNLFSIQSENLNSYMVTGLNLTIGGNIIKKIFSNEDKIDFGLTTHINKVLNNANIENIYPLIDFDFQMIYQLMVNKSELNLGISFRGISNRSPQRLIPIYNVLSLTNSDSGYQMNGGNFFATMKLGNAFLKIMMENLLDQGYYLLSFYPMRGRNIRLSVAWSFFD